jgi:hypothetical protein
LIAVAIVMDVLLAQRGWPSTTALEVAMWSGWLVVRDWPYRAHYLCSVGAGVVLAVLHVGVRSASDQAWWVGSFLVMMSAALFVEGLFDYFALIRARRHT